MLLAPTAQAQSTPFSTLLLLRPHCETVQDLPTPAPSIATFVSDASGPCPNFAIKDPQTQKTASLKAGDTLDMDLILFNGDRKAIHQVRAWLSYDPQVLEGLSFKLSDALPTATPGEADFSAADGQLRIGATALDGKEPATGIIVVARIQFTVKQAAAGGTPISFYDLQTTNKGHTFVTEKASPDANILPGQAGTLLVMTDVPVGATSVSSSSFSSDPTLGNTITNPVQPPEDRTDFTALQLQNVRAGTDGSSLYIAWDPLRSSKIAGYNLYYGTEKGRYIQRRAIGASEHTAAVRGLVPGTQYYIGVRGVSVTNEESAFSREIGIKIGDPASSTSPLGIEEIKQNPATNPLQNTHMQVPGASGAATWVAILLALSACSGTFLAFRRQLSVPSTNAVAADPAFAQHSRIIPSSDGTIILS